MFSCEVICLAVSIGLPNGRCAWKSILTSLEQGTFVFSPVGQHAKIGVWVGY
jgi:hypothetical protein